MVLAGTLGPSVDTGSFWGLEILRQGEPVPANLDLIFLTLFSHLGAEWLLILWAIVLLPRGCPGKLCMSWGLTYANCAYGNLVSLNVKTKITFWGVASSLYLCIYHSSLIVHLHPRTDYSLTSSLNALFQETLYPLLTEICLLRVSPAMLVPYPHSALCYNCLYSQQQKN